MAAQNVGVFAEMEDNWELRLLRLDSVRLKVLVPTADPVQTSVPFIRNGEVKGVASVVYEIFDGCTWCGSLLHSEKDCSGRFASLNKNPKNCVPYNVMQSNRFGPRFQYAFVSPLLDPSASEQFTLHNLHGSTQLHGSQAALMASSHSSTANSINVNEGTQSQSPLTESASPDQIPFGNVDLSCAVKTSTVQMQRSSGPYEPLPFPSSGPVHDAPNPERVDSQPGFVGLGFFRPGPHSALDDSLVRALNSLLPREYLDAFVTGSDSILFDSPDVLHPPSGLTMKPLHQSATIRPHRAIVGGRNDTQLGFTDSWSDPITPTSRCAHSLHIPHCGKGKGMLNHSEFGGDSRLKRPMEEDLGQCPTRTTKKRSTANDLSPGIESGPLMRNSCLSYDNLFWKMSKDGRTELRSDEWLLEMDTDTSLLLMRLMEKRAEVGTAELRQILSNWIGYMRGNASAGVKFFLLIFLLICFEFVS